MKILNFQRDLPDVLHLRRHDLVRLGDVRLRQGKLKEAEDRYRAERIDRENRKAPFEVAASSDGNVFLMEPDTAFAITEYQIVQSTKRARDPTMPLQRFVAAAITA